MFTVFSIQNWTNKLTPNEQTKNVCASERATILQLKLQLQRQINKRHRFYRLTEEKYMDFSSPCVYFAIVLAVCWVVWPLNEYVNMNCTIYKKFWEEKKQLPDFDEFTCTLSVAYASVCLYIGCVYFVQWCGIMVYNIKYVCIKQL